MSCVLDLFSNDVAHTFIRINGTRTLIDHFLLSDNIIHDVIGYSTIDLIDNLSDHLPVFVVFKCSVSYVHALPRIFMPDQTGVGVIVKQLNFIKLF